MPSPLLHLGTTVTCGHGGPAVPAAPSSRVLVDGKPVVTPKSPYLADCPLAKQPGPPPFCATATFVVAATRVLVEGAPVLLANSTGVATPSGATLKVVAPQNRVVGT